MQRNCEATRAEKEAACTQTQRSRSAKALAEAQQLLRDGPRRSARSGEAASKAFEGIGCAVGAAGPHLTVHLACRASVRRAGCAMTRRRRSSRHLRRHPRNPRLPRSSRLPHRPCRRPRRCHRKSWPAGGRWQPKLTAANTELKSKLKSVGARRSRSMGALPRLHSQRGAVRSLRADSGRRAAVIAGCSGAGGAAGGRAGDRRASYGYDVRP